MSHVRPDWNRRIMICTLLIIRTSPSMRMEFFRNCIQRKSFINQIEKNKEQLKEKQGAFLIV